MGRVDIITGTLGKALGGAMGGFTSGRKEIIDILLSSTPKEVKKGVPKKDAEEAKKKLEAAGAKIELK